MRVNNERLSTKIWYTLGSMAILFLLAMFILMLTSFTRGTTLFDIVLYCALLFWGSVLARFVVYHWGYYTIDDTGITRCFFFYKKHYYWYDLKFITKAREVSRRTDQNDRHYTVTTYKIIASVEIPVEDFKRKHTSSMFSDKCFYMPYSEELENYIIAKAPARCYIDSYIIDERISRENQYIK